MWEGKYSNGQASYRKTDTYKACLASLPVTRDDIIRAVPIKSEFLWINLIIHDFIKLYRKPDHHPQINWPSYYAFCLILLLFARKAGGNLDDEAKEIRSLLQSHSARFKINVAREFVVMGFALLIRRVTSYLPKR